MCSTVDRLGLPELQGLGKTLDNADNSTLKGNLDVAFRLSGRVGDKEERK